MATKETKQMNTPEDDDDPFGKKFEEKFNHHFPKHVSYIHTQIYIYIYRQHIYILYNSYNHTILYL